MRAEWRQVGATMKILNIGSQISFVEFGIMILTGLTSLGAMWELSSGAHNVCDRMMDAEEPLH